MKPQIELVEQARTKFARALSKFQAEGGRYHQRAPQLPQKKLDGCEVLNSRLELLNRIADRLCGGVIAEIGVDRGDFSLELLNRCKPSKLHLFDIDLDRLSNPEVLAELEQNRDRLITHAGDSSSNMSKVPDGTFDMIYIDGDHHYEGVKKDLVASVPKLKLGGFLVFNDYATWSPVGMQQCGVARVVHEFVRDNEWRFRYISLQSMMYNDVMIEPIS